jgi:hypothetical protein
MSQEATAPTAPALESPRSATLLAAAPVRPVGLPAEWRALLIVAAHLPLAAIMQRSAAATTLHALVTLGALVATAMLAKRSATIVGMLFYVCGSEVLWRMCRAAIFWETGKYACVLAMVIAGMRLRPQRRTVLPIVYVLLLLPAAAITFLDQPLGPARMQVSFHLSGPLCLGISAWFFARVKLSRNDLMAAFYRYLGPAVAIAAVAALGTMSASDISWVAESNKATSGGFGPNQVSSSLGLGAALIFLLLIEGRHKWLLRATLFTLLLFIGVQSAMTFSRSGLYLAVISSVAAGFFLVGRGRRNVRVLLALMAVGGMAKLVLVPQLDTMTQGTLTRRFADRSATGRDRILMNELQIFFDHPLLGAGVGQTGTTPGDPTLRTMTAHTEYSRLLAEHGSLGLTALLLLIWMSATAIRRVKDPHDRAFTAALLAWGLFFMVANAMRIAAPGVLIGLGASLTWVAPLAKPKPAKPKPAVA